MNSSTPPERRKPRTLLTTCVIWIGLIAIALLLEMLFNQRSSVGSGGFAPIPAIFLSALLLGWIPSLVFAFWFSRRSG